MLQLLQELQIGGTRPADFLRIRRNGGADRRTLQTMADNIVPHFHNTAGVPVIEIGAHEFMCVGEKPPHDHPHVFLDIGDGAEIICPYCSTLYRFDASLEPAAARPAECALTESAAA